MAFSCLGRANSYILKKLSVIKLLSYRIGLLRHKVEYRHGVRYVHIVVVVYVAADKSFVGKQFLFRDMIEHEHGVGDVNLTAAVRVAVNDIKGRLDRIKAEMVGLKHHKTV